MDNMVGAIQQLSSSKITGNNTVENLDSLSTFANSTDNQIKGASFENVVADLTNSLKNKLSAAESLSLQKMSGAQVNTRSVVNSIMEAERALNMTVSIRDKIIEAYKEVSHMQI